MNQTNLTNSRQYIIPADIMRDVSSSIEGDSIVINDGIAFFNEAIYNINQIGGFSFPTLEYTDTARTASQDYSAIEYTALTRDLLYPYIHAHAVWRYMTNEGWPDNNINQSFQRLQSTQSRIIRSLNIDDFYKLDEGGVLPIYYTKRNRR